MMGPPSDRSVWFTFRVPGALNYAVLYIVAEQQFIFFPLFFWVLANDIFDPAQARRLFPFIAAWSFIGKILGSLLTYSSPTLFERLNIASEEVLVINALRRKAHPTHFTVEGALAAVARGDLAAAAEPGLAPRITGLRRVGLGEDLLVLGTLTCSPA